MYHYRIRPLSGEFVSTVKQQLEDIVSCWGNNEAIKNYMQDKIKARYELVLFLEYIPHGLNQWLQENPNRIQASWGELCRTIAFLETKEIIHFDAHFKNVITDRKQIYLTDFGLVLDKSFDLSKEEKLFYDQNLGYDYGEITLNFGHLVVSFYNSFSDQNKQKIKQKYDLRENLKPHELRSVLLENLERIQADDSIKLDPFFLNSLIKYREIIQLVHSFLVNLQNNDKNDTKFPQKTLRSLLKEVGFP
jgi:hypothetical protein